MIYYIRQSYTRNCLLIRGFSTERIADHMRFAPVSRVLNFDGHKFLITHSMAKVGRPTKGVRPYTGYFPRVVLFIRNYIETIKGLN